MERKARREGKPADAYLSKGRVPPTVLDVAELRKLDAKQRMGWWASRFGQHCLAFHAEGSCARANSAFGCAFLHEQPVKNTDVPSWLQEDVEARF
eukprot:6195922-Pleurochrysis_carterae.AAC.2